MSPEYLFETSASVSVARPVPSSNGVSSHEVTWNSAST